MYVSMVAEFVPSKKGYEIESGSWLDEKAMCSRSKSNHSRAHKIKAAKMPGFRSSVRDLAVA